MYDVFIVYGKDPLWYGLPAVRIWQQMICQMAKRIWLSVRNGRILRRDRLYSSEDKIYKYFRRLDGAVREKW